MSSQYHNPLCAAVAIQDSLLEIQGEIMHAIAGDAAFEPFDDELCAAVEELIYKSTDAVTHLSPRARHARLNMIWQSFVTEQKAKIATPAQGVSL